MHVMIVGFLFTNCGNFSGSGVSISSRQKFICLSTNINFPVIYTPFLSSIVSLSSLSMRLRKYEIKSCK